MFKYILTMWTKGTKYPNNPEENAKDQIKYFLFFQLSTLNNFPQQPAFLSSLTLVAEESWEGISDMKLKEAKIKMATRPDKKKNVFLNPNDSKEPSKMWGITMVKMELPEATIPLTLPICFLK